MLQPRDLPNCYGAWETVAGRFYAAALFGTVAADSGMERTAEKGINYNEMVASADNFVIGGEDAETKQPIRDAKLAAQIWLKNEDKVMNFASIKNMMTALKKLQGECLN